MKRKVLYLLIVSVCHFNYVFAQGCSDAGFCTTGNIKALATDSSTIRKQQLSFYFTNGIGDESVFVFTPGIQYDNTLNANWALQAKLTANYASGTLGNVFGLGDVILSSTYTKKYKYNQAFSFLLGTKLPLNLSDIKIDNKSLPMQYQSSMGTIDLIAGFTFISRKWLFATAYQQPLSGINRNTFLPAYWKNIDAAKYPSTNDFNRKGDALVRVGYNFIVSEKVKFNAGFLGIYHLGEDTYVDGNISNKPIKIKGSDGLTLNGTIAFRYKVNNTIDLILSGGMPFVVRDVRPDGLTRSFVLSPEIAFKF